MSTTRSFTRAPALIRRSNSLTGALLRRGLPMGPNVLMTVRGRTSGEPRTAPVAVPEIDGRRYVIGAYGDVNWVRNLRAAGEAQIAFRRRKDDVRATELDPTQRVAFFRDTLGPVARTIPFGRAFIRIVDGTDLDKPEEAAEGRPVFELELLR